MKKLNALKNAATITSAFLLFACGVTIAQNENTIPASGNVGLGTTTPSRKFQVHSTTSMGQMYVSGANPSIFLGDHTTVTSATKMATFAMPTAANAYATGTAAGDLILSSKSGKLQFITGSSVNSNGSIRMTIGGSNATTPLVGIGTTSPTSNLHIIGMYGTTSNAPVKIESPNPNPDGGFYPNHVMLLEGKSINTVGKLSINDKTNSCVNIGTDVSHCWGRLLVNGYTNGLDETPTLTLTSKGFSETMKFDGKRIETSSNLLLNSISKKNVGIGTATPGAALHVVGAGNDGNTATIKVESGAQILLLDGNEIDGLTSLHLNSNSEKNVLICEKTGNVGVGTDNPDLKFHVRGNESDGTTGAVKISCPGQSMILDGNEIDATSNGLYLNYNSKNNVLLCANGGNVGIGTDKPANKLDVVGTVRAEEIIVATGWADFVFEKGYDLKTLKSVEEFIHKNGHLPEIPNAEEVAKNGVKVGEVEAKLLMKIEELTLYLINQDKRINELEAQLGKK